MSVVVLALLGILLLVFLVAAIYSGRNLIWPHMLIWIGLFLLTISFLVASSWAARAKGHWHEQFAETRSELEQVQNERQQITSQLGQLRHVTRTELVGRGRVWRNLAIAGFNPQGVVLDASRWNLDPCVGEVSDMEPIPSDAANELPADGAAVPAAQPAAPTHGLRGDMIVFAFRELPLARLPEPLQQAILATAESDDEAAAAGDDAFYRDETRAPFCRVPLVYVGQFRVVGAAGNQVTLASTEPIDPQQLAQANPPGQGLSWALYERLPIDQPDALAGLTAEQIQQLLPPQQVGLQGPAYEALIRDFAQHGQTIPEAADPEHTWVRVRFLQAQTVDVDAPGDAALGQEGFDPMGRAIGSALRQGEEVSFQAGDEAEFDWQTAEALRGQQLVEWIGFVYRRDLRDYGWMFAESARQRALLLDQQQLAQSDLQLLQAALTSLQEQQQAFEAQKADLQHDHQHLQQVQQALDQFGQQLEQRWNQVRQQASALFRSNFELRSQLEAQRSLSQTE